MNHREPLVWLTFFSLLISLLAQNDDIYIPLKTFEEPVLLNPNLPLITFPYNFLANVLKKIECVDTEKLYLMNNGRSIILFKIDSTNYFNFGPTGFTILSFSLIQGTEKVIIIAKNPSMISTTISIYNWRLRKFIKEVSVIGRLFKDVIHLPGTNFGLLCKI